MPIYALEARREHLFHQQAGGDGFKGIGDGFLGGIRLGDEIGEAGAGLARRVAGRAADDLDDLGVSKSSASKSAPSVARMKRAFALAVAGLAFSAASIFVTSPGAAAAI